MEVSNEETKEIEHVSLIFEGQCKALYSTSTHPNCIIQNTKRYWWNRRA